MKQLVQNYKTGELRVEEVPPPTLKPGGMLVRNIYSLISAGTEKAKIELARKNLLAKAKEKPEQARRVLETLKKEGILNTYRKVMTKLEAPSPLGYSSAGMVIEVGKGVDEFKVGERVACAGAGYAVHAEVIFVPKNLCVKIPDEVGFDYAAFTTLGAIAMQGIRQAQLTLGENIVVIGLGVVGQLTIQIIKAAGCKVTGIDIDSWKVELAKKLGTDGGVVRGRDDIVKEIKVFSGGRGIDAVIITAGTSSSDPVELAGKILRDRGRVVVVGAVKMDIPRKNYYEKELSLSFSRSYGPGRYDPIYEEKGIDYPIGYVRWTEKRNMEEFLTLISERKVNLEPLITHRFKIEDALQAYEIITGKRKEKFLGILLKYEENKEQKSKISLKAVDTSKAKPHLFLKKVNLGIIGAGSFAQNFLLPNLKKISSARFKGVATATGINAKHVAKKFGFEYATTKAEDIINDPEVDAIIIATRHNLHSELTIKALEKNKAVFVEKPLSLSEEELKEVIKAWEKSQRRLMVGFNRRFAPLVEKAKEFYHKRRGPLAMIYRVNAGYIPKNHWIQDLKEGGGRIIGEVCHFVDLLEYFVNAKPTKIYAQSILDDREDITNNDTINISLKFEDSSIGSLSYLACGDSSFPKERIEIFGGDSVALIDDFKNATFSRGGKTKKIKRINEDKGHRKELEVFVEAVKSAKEMPIKFEEIVTTTLVTFKILESLEKGVPIEISELRTFNA